MANLSKQITPHRVPQPQNTSSFLTADVRERQLHHYHPVEDVSSINDITLKDG